MTTISKIKEWQEKQVIVYRSNSAPIKVPADQALADTNTEQYQSILNELGVNTLGINQPIRTKGTYQEVIKAIQKFRERIITQTDRDYSQKLDLEKAESAHLTRKLAKVKELLVDNDVEKLKRLMEKGEI